MIDHIWMIKMSLGTLERKWIHLKWRISYLRDLRAIDIINNELDLTWVIWKFQNPFDILKAFFNTNGYYLNALE